MIETLPQKATRLNSILEKMSTAQERMQYVLGELGKHERVVLTTSFGMQSAMMLHLVTTATSEVSARSSSRVPVVWIDTGYLPAETYAFADQLTDSLKLDLRVYQSSMTPARMEATYGKLWEDESDGAHKKYNFIRKVEPMKRALEELQATVVLSGVRAGQTSHRQNMKMVHVHNGRLKICPVLDWTDEQVHALFEENALPYHPLKEQGYVSVGDWHSSAPFDPKIHQNERDTRFHGRTQECGLHLSDPEPEQELEANKRDSKLGMMVPGRHLSTSSLTSGTGSLSVSIGDSDGFVLFTKPNCRFCKAAKALLEHLRNDEKMNQLNYGKGELRELDESTPTLATDDDSASSSSMSYSSTSSFTVSEEIVVGKDIRPSELSQALGGRTVKTVPQILYRGTYIGGYESLVAWLQKTFPHANMPDTQVLSEKYRSQ